MKLPDVPDRYDAGNERETRRIITDALGGVTDANAVQSPRSLVSPTTHLLNNAVYNVKDYRATGDGVTDDTVAIQGAVTAAGANGIVLFPQPSSFYKCTGLITVGGAGQQWIGNGKVIVKWTTLGAATLGSLGSGTAGILVNANDFSIRQLALRGPTTASYVGNATLVLMTGTSTSARKSGLTLTDVEVYETGAYGVFAQFVDRIRLTRCYIHNVGYAGVSLLSCSHYRGVGNHYKTITPGTGGNMYGLTWTHDSTGYAAGANPGTKQATHPFCWDCVEDGALVEDCAWTGLDAHGGYECAFVNARVYACKLSIAMTGGSGDAANYAGTNNKVADCVCDAANQDGTSSGRENTYPGIECSGGATVRNDSLLVSGNTIRNHAVVSNAEGAGIRAHYCRNSKFTNNIIEKWGGVGINVDAEDNEIDGNHIGALANAADTVGHAISCLTNGTGNLAVTSNVVRASTGTAARIGFNFANLSTTPVVSGNDFTAATVSQTTGPSAGVQRGSDYPNILTVTNNATTVDVSGLTPGVPGIIDFQYTAATTVTNLTNGRVGQIVTLMQSNANAITFDRTNAALAGSANFVGTQYDTLTLVRGSGALWLEISRAANG